MAMTPRQQKALAALLTSPSRAAAAEAAGITTRTLQNYLSDPEFQREYQKALSGLISEAAAQAKQSLSPALSTLKEVMTDTEQNGQIRVSAARSLLEFGMKLTEQADILARLQELETAMEGVHNGKY